MSKKRLLVIILIIVLAAGAVAGAVFLWQQRGQEGTGEPKATPDNSFGMLTPAEEANRQEQALAEAADGDGDGLTEAEEKRWGSDPTKADTDGDGYLDGEEIKANHDPLVPAPNDLLTNTRATRPAAPAAVALTMAGVESFFADNLDLANNKNLTEEYKKEYPAEEQSPAALSEFAVKQPVIDLLPRPEQGLLPAGEAGTSAVGLETYLAVANNPNVLANATLYRQAQYDLTVSGNPETMRGLGKLVESYRGELTSVPVPEAAGGVHKILLGYTELLVDTFNDIAGYNEDPARSLVAMRQLEVIDRKYYPLVYNEFQRLTRLQQAL